MYSIIRGAFAPMEWQAIITLLVILGAIILFVSEWISVDLVALLIMVTLGHNQVVTPRER